MESLFYSQETPNALKKGTQLVFFLLLNLEPNSIETRILKEYFPISPMLLLSTFLPLDPSSTNATMTALTPPHTVQWSHILPDQQQSREKNLLWK